MSVLVLTETSFDSETANGVTLVDFWAPWCMPCKAMMPILDQVASLTAHLGDVSVGKVNVDEVPALANRFSVSSIPTLVLFKDGKLVDRKVGMQPVQALITSIEAVRKG